MSSVLRNLPLTSGVFLVVFLLSAASAQKNFELSPQSDLESLEEIQDLLRKVQLVFETKVASKVRQGIVPDDESEITADPNGCTCSGYECSCCVQIHLHIISGNGCIQVTYVPARRAIVVALTVGGFAIFSRQVTVRNPPPICGRISRLSRNTYVCIELNRIQLEANSLSACATATVKRRTRTLLNVDVGCFKMDFSGASQHSIGEVELPYLDGDKAAVKEPELVYP